MEGNGRLTLTDLARVYHPSVHVYLRHDAALAWAAMRQASLAHHGVDIFPLGGISAYRTYSQQVAMKQHWASLGQPQKAAMPGTSNHGWGLAVDAGGGNSARMWACLRELGPHYGWSHDEGLRVGEDWHFRYVGGYTPPDPLGFLTDREERLVKELLALRRLKHPTAAQIRRRKSVWRWLRDQRKRIFHEAQKTGWEKAHRARRYKLLRGLTHT